ncbi:type I restriction endonuclease subunit R [Pleomorphomonas sp. JP5]|uniref:type I restriction endonuclease subunit R n=1 Tax=Pleomorphomonas sp. JP5 TaxID=2942998 RepID=UPI0020445619|nr:type I restriction endonuclease subunit R [Pleomorphomonas sp. JP5]MCM5560071.1 type I restriction endonuclease subunit R [Pleomorphomonas sp. JP5]
MTAKPEDVLYGLPPGTRATLSGFSEDSLVEKPAIELFEELGWRHVDLYEETFGADGSPWRENRRDAFLTKPLRAALARLNPGLPSDALDLAFDIFTRDRAAMVPIAANREVLEFLRDGIDVEFSEDGGMVRERVRVIDWRDLSVNDFTLVSQVWMTGELHTRRADLVGFVNGVPLLFVELKAGHRRVDDAYRDNIRDYRDTIPQLFRPNGFVLVSNGLDTRIGASVHAPWDTYKEWKRIDDETEPGCVSLETAIRAAATPERLADLVENFLIFEATKDGLVKKIAQNHQFLGVNKAVAAVGRLGENRGKLGVFWHTQGSGKSLSMLTFARKVLRTMPGAWTFVIVTDREELDKQISETFAACGAVTKGLDEVRAGSKEHLKALLRGNERFVFTLINKFGTAKGETFPVLSERSDIIVIADEAHRSQYDTLAANMRRALPNAAFIGFTGTPLMAGEEKTRDVFGDYVSTYTYQQSTEDGATVPLYYENRIPELEFANESFSEELEAVIEEADLDEDQERELERRLGTQYHLITRNDRLDRIAEDIVRHFVGRGYRGKAMFVAIDKATALRMHDKVRRAWDAEIAHREAALATAPEDQRPGLAAVIAFMRETDMAVIVSQGQNEIADMEAKGLDIRPHRKRMNDGELDEHFKKPDDPLRLVFVCAMWITGFDVPTCSTIYLDKPMKNHTLMQTIARANRNAPGKKAGLIVDYVGVFRNLQRALAIYAVGGTTTRRPIEDKGALVEELATAVAEALAFCRAHGVEPESILEVTGFERLRRLGDAVEGLNGTDPERRAFLALASNVWSTFKAVLPDARAEPWRRISAAIEVIAERIRALTERPDISEVAGRIEALLDDSIAGVEITAPIRLDGDIEGLFDLSRLDVERLRAMFETGNRQRTETQRLRRAVEARLEEMAARNPTRRSLVERFEALVDQYNAGSLTAEALFAQLLTLIGDLDTEDHRAIREGLSEEELAIFDILTQPEPKLGPEDEDLVKRVAKSLLDKLKAEKLILDWRLKERAKAAVKATIATIYDEGLPPAYDQGIFDDKVERTYQWVFEKYPAEQPGWMN